MRFTYCTYLFKTDFANRSNVSGNFLRSYRKNMSSITKVPILEEYKTREEYRRI